MKTDLFFHPAVFRPFRWPPLFAILLLQE